MAGEIDKRAIIDDEAVSVFADDRCLHPIVEDFVRRAADRLESGDMTAQDALRSERRPLFTDNVGEFRRARGLRVENWLS